MTPIERILRRLDHHDITRVCTHDNHDGRAVRHLRGFGHRKCFTVFRVER